MSGSDIFFPRKRVNFFAREFGPENIEQKNEYNETFRQETVIIVAHEEKLLCVQIHDGKS